VLIAATTHQQQISCTTGHIKMKRSSLNQYLTEAAEFLRSTILFFLLSQRGLLKNGEAWDRKRLMPAYSGWGGT
jgi:hypothetical protein